MYSIIGYLKVEQGDAEAALAFNREALDYDDADPVFLDNMGQTYYRLVGDKETAKTYFDKAIALKPTAIDTNYFLSLYDIGRATGKKLSSGSNGAQRFFSAEYATPAMIDEKALRSWAQRRGVHLLPREQSTPLTRAISNS